MPVDHLYRELLNTALDLYRTEGFADVNADRIARSAGCSLDELYSRFPRKEAFVMGLYERIAERLRTVSCDAPAGTVSYRFQFLMRHLLHELEGDRELLRHLMPAMLDPVNRLGILGQSTDRIRAEVQGMYSVLVLGASDAPPHDESDSLVQFLYFAHLGLIFLFLQDQRDDPEFMKNNVQLAGDLIQISRTALLGSGQSWVVNRLAAMAGIPRPDQLKKRVDRLVGDFIRPPHDSAHFSTGENILRDLFQFRRLQPGAGDCEKHPCPQCLALHLPRVQRSLEMSEPLSLVLPAFPAKSGNMNKVLGALPDLGEELALRFLQERAEQIASHHPVGCQLTICSDGRVFSDLVGVRDEEVTAYRLALIELIDRLGLTSLQVFDLDDVHDHADFDSMRQWLMDCYGEPLQELEQRTREHEHHQQLLNGIHRFMFEDLLAREPGLSRTQARKRSKSLAYEVIRRSNAWSRLVAEFFPQSLRLSIHPHPAHSDKIGILMGDADDLWLTPWHGVALLEADRFCLTRRAQAEELGAKLMTRNGRASHFELATDRGNGE